VILARGRARVRLPRTPARPSRSVPPRDTTVKKIYIRGMRIILNNPRIPLRCIMTDVDFERGERTAAIDKLLRSSSERVRGASENSARL